MKILHICSNFAGSKVHVELYKRLAHQGEEQVVYCPIRDEKLLDKNCFEAHGTQIIYDYVIKPYHRYLYHIKRADMFRSLQKKLDLNSVSFCHAATLFTDGGQAYEIWKKYHIPYVVAVRNMDVNGFLDIRPETWCSGKKILENACRIFFISKGLMEKFCNHRIVKPILQKIKDKMMLVPNGIDDYYLDHIYHGSQIANKVLYVGDFSNNKNVVRLAQAILELKKEDGFDDIKLTLVGGGHNETNQLQQMVDSNPDVFDYLGPVYDKERLCEVFRAHSIFAMPSIYETFGLVYIEALSQGLPVLYTKGQGVDGLLPPNAGIGVNPLSAEEIRNALRTMLSQRSEFNNMNVNFEQYRWNNIATTYMTVYKDVFENNNK